MVRLKVTSNDNYSIDEQISIPYGAIKSYLLKALLFEHPSISIPYGAIKSNLSNPDNF